MGINKDTRDKIKDRRKLKNLIRKNKNSVGLKQRLKTMNKDIKKGMNEEKLKNWHYIKTWSYKIRRRNLSFFLPANSIQNPLKAAFL